MRREKGGIEREVGEEERNMRAGVSRRWRGA